MSTDKFDFLLKEIENDDPVELKKVLRLVIKTLNEQQKLIDNRQREQLAASDGGPSKVCKKAGLKSLRELAELSGQSDQTLTNWYNNKRQLFDLVLLGATVADQAGRVERMLGADYYSALPAILRKQTT